jgi:isopenicillin N synthase-like dioxygenase
MDQKEVYHVGQELPREHPCYDATLFAPNVYPPLSAGAPGFERALRAHWSEMMALSNLMFQIFARCLGLPPQHFKPLSDEGMNSMNTIHYPPLHPDASPDQPGIGAHTDFECFTLLAQREGSPSALEVLSPVTGKWERVAFPKEPDALVVNVGDMMARWSNGVTSLRRTLYDHLIYT